MLVVSFNAVLWLLFAIFMGIMLGTPALSYAFCTAGLCYDQGGGWCEYFAVYGVCFSWLYPTFHPTVSLTTYYTHTLTHTQTTPSMSSTRAATSSSPSCTPTLEFASSLSSALSPIPPTLDEREGGSAARSEESAKRQGRVAGRMKIRQRRRQRPLCRRVERDKLARTFRLPWLRHAPCHSVSSGFPGHDESRGGDTTLSHACVDLQFESSFSASVAWPSLASAVSFRSSSSREQRSTSRRSRKRCCTQCSFGVRIVEGRGG